MTIAPGSSVLSAAGRTPAIDPGAFVAPGARVVGGVTLSEGASVWYNAVLRADGDTITIGVGSNLQDNVSVHVDAGHPVVIGKNVSVGHNAVVLSGAVIGEGCLIAGGAVVLEGAVIPPGSLVAGVPAKVRRELTDDERAGILRNAQAYREHVVEHENARSI